MDFLHRSASSANGQSATLKENTTGFGTSENKGFKKYFSQPNWLRIASVVMLFSLTILAVAIVLLLSFGRPKASSLVNPDKIQAVFLTNGQVYFGKIASINDQYIDLRNIYYLNTQQSSDNQNNQQTPVNFTLVKLGCELHGPADQMIINQDQVSFWENLKEDGKVTKAIQQWIKENPDGLKCKTTTNSTQQSIGNNNTNNSDSTNNSNNSNNSNSSNNNTNGTNNTNNQNNAQ